MVFCRSKTNGRNKVSAVVFKPKNILGVLLRVMRKVTKTSIAAAAIILLHVVGTIGMLLPQWQPLMRALTPLNLVIVFALVLTFQVKQNTSFYFFSTICFALAFFAEVVGVKTGWPFGDYTYGATLGPKILDVPVIIGANWVVLVLCTASLCRRIDNKWLASAAGALLMVGMDFLIEPVAIAHDYWTWVLAEVPLQNYMAWGALAFILHRLLYFSGSSTQNELDIYVVSAQFFFFLMLNVIA